MMLKKSDSRDGQVFALIVTLIYALVATTVMNRFLYVMHTPKFLIMLIFLVGMSIVILFRKKRFVIPADKKIQLCILGVSVFFLISTFLATTGETIAGSLRVLFWVLLVFNTAAFLKKDSLLNFLQKICIYQIPFVLLIFIITLNNELIEKSSMRPFFGNPNVAGNYVALCLISMVWGLKQNKNKLFRILSFVIIAMGVFLLFSLKARGATVGLIVGLLYLLHKISKTIEIKKVFKQIALFLILSVAGIILFQKGFKSLEYRYSYWLNTLCMVGDHPMGIGPGAFRFVFESYSSRCYPELETSERMITTSPHNMYLEILVEAGIGVSVLLLIMFFFVFREIRSTSKNHPVEVQWLFAQALLLLVIGFFDFSQYTPITFFFMALVCAVALVLIKTDEVQIPFFKLINLSGVLLLSGVMATQAYAEIVLRWPDAKFHEKYKRSCHLNSESWGACSALCNYYLMRRDWINAEPVLKNLDQKFKDFSQVSLMWAKFYQIRGDKVKSCEQFKKYDFVFKERSSVRNFIVENCTGN